MTNLLVGYPCFGYNQITGKEWWRNCVLRSLELAGATMDHELEERVFQRIYSIFGSQLAYERFEDALPFIHWAGRHGVSCGLLSNADDRYGTLASGCCVKFKDSVYTLWPLRPFDPS